MVQRTFLAILLFLTLAGIARPADIKNDGTSTQNEPHAKAFRKYENVHPVHLLFLDGSIN